MVEKLLLKCKSDKKEELRTNIYERIKQENHRPLLRKNFSVEKISSIMKLREKNYRKADITIDTTGKTPQLIAEEIIGVLKLNG